MNQIWFNEDELLSGGKIWSLLNFSWHSGWVFTTFFEDKKKNVSYYLRDYLIALSVDDCSSVCSYEDIRKSDDLWAGFYEFFYFKNWFLIKSGIVSKKKYIKKFLQNFSSKFNFIK